MIDFVTQQHRAYNRKSLRRDFIYEIINSVQIFTNENSELIRVPDTESHQVNENKVRDYLGVTSSGSGASSEQGSGEGVLPSGSRPAGDETHEGDGGDEGSGASGGDGCGGDGGGGGGDDDNDDWEDRDDSIVSDITAEYPLFTYLLKDPPL